MATTLSHQTQAPATLQKRLFYLDNIRALAMFLGVVLHVSLPYTNLLGEVWMIANQTQSQLIDFLYTFIHLFRMALFFLVAGFFSYYLVEKRGLGGYLKHRFIRIVIPFCLFCPFLQWSFLAIADFSAGYLDQISDIAAMLHDRTLPLHQDSMHLWFLYHLWIFCCVAAIAVKINIKGFSQIVLRVMQSPWSLVYLPLISIPGLYYAGLPHEAPSSLLYQAWPLSYYGLYFLLGWHFFKQPQYLNHIQNWLLPTLVFCVMAFMLFYSKLEPVRFSDWIAILNTPDYSPPFSWDYLLGITLESYLSFYLVLISLLLGKRFLNRQNAPLRYGSDAAYWVYLTHLPLAYFIQVLIGNWEINLWLEFLFTLLTTLAICLISYHLCVRYTWLGRILNGKKTRPKPDFKASIKPKEA